MDNVPQNIKIVDYVRSLYLGRSATYGIFERRYMLPEIILQKLLFEEDLNYIKFYTTEIGFSKYGKKKHNRHNRYAI